MPDYQADAFSPDLILHNSHLAKQASEAVSGLQQVLANSTMVKVVAIVSNEIVDSDGDVGKAIETANSRVDAYRNYIQPGYANSESLGKSRAFEVSK